METENIEHTYRVIEEGMASVATLEATFEPSIRAGTAAVPGAVIPQHPSCS